MELVISDRLQMHNIASEEGGVPGHEEKGEKDNMKESVVDPVSRRTVCAKGLQLYSGLELYCVHCVFCTVLGWPS